MLAKKTTVKKPAEEIIIEHGEEIYRILVETFNGASIFRLGDQELGELAGSDLFDHAGKHIDNGWNRSNIAAAEVLLTRYLSRERLIVFVHQEGDTLAAVARSGDVLGVFVGDTQIKSFRDRLPEGAILAAWGGFRDRLPEVTILAGSQDLDVSSLFLGREDALKIPKVGAFSKAYARKSLGLDPDPVKPSALAQAISTLQIFQALTRS